MNDRWEKIRDLWRRLPDRKRKSLALAAGTAFVFLAGFGVVVSDLLGPVPATASAQPLLWRKSEGSVPLRLDAPEKMVRPPAAASNLSGSWPTGERKRWRKDDARPNDPLDMILADEKRDALRDLAQERSLSDQNSSRISGGLGASSGERPSAHKDGAGQPPAPSNPLLLAQGLQRGGRFLNGSKVMGISMSGQMKGPNQAVRSGQRGAGLGPSTPLGASQISHNAMDPSWFRPVGSKGSAASSEKSSGAGWSASNTGSSSGGSWSSGSSSDSGSSTDSEGESSSSEEAASSESASEEEETTTDCSLAATSRCTAYICAAGDIADIEAAVQSAASAVQKSMDSILSSVTDDLSDLISEEQSWVGKTQTSYSCDGCDGVNECLDTARKSLEAIITLLQKEKSLAGTATTAVKAFDMEPSIVNALEAHAGQAEGFGSVCTSLIPATVTQTSYNSSTKKYESVEVPYQAGLAAKSAFSSQASAEAAAQREIAAHLKEPWTSRYPLASSVDTSAVTKAAGELRDHADGLDVYSDLVSGDLTSSVRSAADKLDEAATLLANGAGNGGRDLLVGANRIEEARTLLSSAKAAWNRGKQQACSEEE